MNLLLDNNLSPQLIESLSEHGHQVDHVRNHGMQAAPDEAVLQLAADSGQVLITADTDFGQLLRQSQASTPSVVIIRTAGSRRPAAQAALLLANLPAIEQELDQGALAVIEDTRIRVRELPL